MGKGKLIVLEGTDGSGKETQTKRLCETLTQYGYKLRQLSFPCYGTTAAGPLEMYLRGDFGKHAAEVSPYAASMFYATDRFASYKTGWGKFYEDGGLIISDRYTTSNAVHQASKLRPEERRSFLDWLFDLEYRRLGLPEPDRVLYLDMPTEAANRLMRRREAETNTAADIHEQDGDYLRRCRECAGEIARTQGWAVVNCAGDGVPRTPEDIHREVLAIVLDCLSR